MVCKITVFIKNFRRPFWVRHFELRLILFILVQAALQEHYSKQERPNRFIFLLLHTEGIFLCGTYNKKFSFTKVKRKSMTIDGIDE